MNAQASSSSSSAAPLGSDLSLDLNGKFDLFAQDVGPIESALQAQGGRPSAFLLQQIRACQANGDRTGRFAINLGVEHGSWLSVEGLANPYLLVTEGTGQFRFTFTTTPPASTALFSSLSLFSTASTSGCSLDPASSALTVTPVEGVPGLWEGSFRVVVEFDEELKRKLREEECGEEMVIEETFYAAKSLRQEEEEEDAVDWMREEEEDDRGSDIGEEDEEME